MSTRRMTVNEYRKRTRKMTSDNREMRAFISRTLNELTKANEDTFSFFSALWIDGARLLQKVDEK